MCLWAESVGGEEICVEVRCVFFLIPIGALEIEFCMDSPGHGNIFKWEFIKGNRKVACHSNFYSLGM